MDNTVVVEILDTLDQLESELSGSLLCDLETSLLEVVEEILSFHVLHDNIVIFRIFEKILKLNDVGVLAHLEHLNLLSLLKNFDRFHVFLFDSLDSHEITSFFVLS